MRTCIGCRVRASKSEMLRVTARDGACLPDPRSRQPGRGAYLHPATACLGLAERRRAFPRALRVAGALDVAPVRAWIHWPDRDTQMKTALQRLRSELEMSTSMGSPRRACPSRTSGPCPDSRPGGRGPRQERSVKGPGQRCGQGTRQVQQGSPCLASGQRRVREVRRVHHRGARRAPTQGSLPAGTPGPGESPRGCQARRRGGGRRGSEGPRGSGWPGQPGDPVRTATEGPGPDNRPSC